MGSKDKYAKYLLPYILQERTKNQWYVEPFAGGCNMIDKVDGNRIANDANHYVIALFNHLQWGGILPEYTTKEQYKHVLDNKDMYPSWMVGYVGICCSYSGKWFGGFAGKTVTRNGIRNYQEEANRNLLKQAIKIKDIIFKSQEYFDLKIPENSVIYCDPPYEGTTKYFTSFNHGFFWDWCRQQNKNGHKVFVSEYNAPPDFKLLLSIEAKSSLSANGVIGGSKKSIEKLFTI